MKTTSKTGMTNYLADTRSEYTHDWNPEERRYVQTVTARELRATLLDSGDSLDRPADFTDRDEWRV